MNDTRPTHQKETERDMRTVPAPNLYTVLLAAEMFLRQNPNDPNAETIIAAIKKLSATLAEQR